MRRGADLLAWLASLPPGERDRAVEQMLGIGPTSSASPGPHLVGHHLTSVAAIVRAVHEVPVRADDVVLDIGAGVGKLLALVHLFTGASVFGVEVQRELVERALPIANVRLGDARSCLLTTEGEEARPPSVVFLYCPFDGPVLVEVSRRLDALAEIGPLVVCALGVELRCAHLHPRPNTDFWMTIWERESPRASSPMPPLAQLLAHERS